MAIISTLLFFYLADAYSGFGFNSRMNHQVNLLSRLNDLTEAPLEQEKDLVAVRDSLVTKLDKYATRSRGLSFVSNWFTRQRIVKFVCASAVWFLAAIAVYISSLSGDKNFLIAGLVAVIAFSMDVIGALIPTVGMPILNYLFNFFVLSLAPTWAIVVNGRRTNRQS